MNSLPPTSIGLDFGTLAAEREGQHLQAYFFESQSFKLLLGGKRAVVLGNRGVGKTALFKMIAAHYQKQNGVVVEVSPEEYSYELLSSTMASETRGSWAKHGAYAAAWKYLLYVLAMKAYASRPGLRTGAARRIYEYVRDRHANFEKNPIGSLISYLKRLEGIKVGSYEASLKAAELHKMYKLEELTTVLADLESVAKSSAPIVILIDELDRGWDASEDAKAFVGGLFQAATTMPSLTPSVRILVSLRKELYDNIPSLYEDAQKYRDIIETVRWTEADLFQLICNRIAHVVPGLASLPLAQRWSALFGSDGSFKSFNYIVERTLLRPRELIQFCNDIARAATASNQKFPVSRELIAVAEVQYSQERLRDIASEYRFQFPALDSVFESFRGMGALLTREELELHCMSILMGDVRVGDATKAWLASMDSEDMIHSLWQVGFLRCLPPSAGEARYYGVHEAPGMVVKNSRAFQVHPMFRRGLGMLQSA